MRTTFSRSNTKILPSPILPVLAAFSIASSARSSMSLLMAASIFTFGRKSTTYSAPRYSSVWPFCRPKPLTSVTVMPCTPIAESASRTSSSLNGLMTAVTSFMCSPFAAAGVATGCRPYAGSECLADRQHHGALAGVPGLVDAVGIGQVDAAVAEAVKLALAAIALGVGIDVGRTQHPAVDVLRHADLPVGVAGIVHVLELQAADVAVDAPAVAQIVGRAEIEVVRVLGARRTEVVPDHVVILEREPFPAAADVDLGVVHLAAQHRAGPVVGGAERDQR